MKDEKTAKRRNLGTFETREAAEKHEKEAAVRGHYSSLTFPNRCSSSPTDWATLFELTQFVCDPNLILGWVS